VEDAVEADIGDRRDAAHSAQVLPIALAQRQRRASGSKHALPEMREWPRRRRRIHRDAVRTDLCVYSRDGERQYQ